MRVIRWVGRILAAIAIAVISAVAVGDLMLWEEALQNTTVAERAVEDYLALQQGELEWARANGAPEGWVQAQAKRMLPTKQLLVLYNKKIDRLYEMPLYKKLTFWGPDADQARWDALEWSGRRSDSIAKVARYMGRSTFKQ